MQLRVSRAFWLCLLAAVGLLAGLTFRGASPLVVFGASVAPLVLYHLTLVAALRAGRLSSSAIDTVYYLGFLITIATLALSVAKVGWLGEDAFRDGKKLQELAVVFGLGLSATGYALFARMQLLLRSERLGEEGLDDKFDRYVVEAERALEKLRLSAVEFEIFSQTLRESAQRAVKAAEESSSTAIANTAASASEVIKSTSLAFQLAVDSFQADFKRAASPDDISAMLASLKPLSGALRKVLVESTALAEGLQSVKVEFTALTPSVTELNANISNLHSHIGNIVEFSTPLSDLRATVAMIGPQLRALGGETGSAKAALTDAASVISAELDAAQDSLRKLTQAKTQLTEEIAATAESIKSNRELQTQADEVLSIELKAIISSLATHRARLSEHVEALHRQTELVEKDSQKRIAIFELNDSRLNSLITESASSVDRMANIATVMANTATAVRDLEGATVALRRSIERIESDRINELDGIRTPTVDRA